MKQIGLAFQSSHNSTGYIPTAGGDGGGVDNSAVSRVDFGWCYEILPYIEQGALQNQPNVAVIRATPVATFGCPTRGGPRVINGGAMSDLPATAAPTQTPGRARFVPAPWSSAEMDWQLPRTQASCNSKTSPTGGRTPCSSARNSLTRTQPVATTTNSGLVLGSMATSFRGSDPVGSSWRTPRQDARLGDIPDEYYFGSKHPTGMNAVLGDGAVRFIKYSVDPTQFMRLCHRMDEAPVNID